MEVFSPSYTPSDTPMWLSILSSLRKGVAETTKLLSEIHADRMRAHSSANSNTVLTAPERAVPPAPVGAHTPASEEDIPLGPEEASHSRSADEPLQS